MKTHNSFPEGTRLMFQDAWACWMCGENTADALHHIVGRGIPGSDEERSVFNAAPLCNQKCHLRHHGMLRTEEYVRALLKQTKKYLENYGYIPNSIDKAFLLKYAHFYK